MRGLWAAASVSWGIVSHKAGGRSIVMLIFAVEATMTVTKTSPHLKTPELSQASAVALRPAVRVRTMTAGMTGMTRVGLKSLQLEGKLCCRRSSEKLTDYFQLETTQVFQVF